MLLLLAKDGPMLGETPAVWRCVTVDMPRTGSGLPEPHAQSSIPSGMKFCFWTSGYQATKVFSFSQDLCSLGPILPVILLNTRDALDAGAGNYMVKPFPARGTAGTMAYRPVATGMARISHSFQWFPLTWTWRHTPPWLRGFS